MVDFYTGDIFDSKADIIAHQVNCQGRMGSCLALQVRTRYPNVFGEYHKAYRLGTKKLGDCLLVPTFDGRKIANLYGQKDYGYDGALYTDYSAIRNSLVALKALIDPKEVVAFPYLMSCDRGGGEWKTVYNYICNVFDGYDIEIWRLPPKKDEGE